MDVKDNAIGAGVGLGVGIGAVLALRPGVRKMVSHSIRSIGKGGSRAVAAAEKIPPSVQKDAREVAKALRKSGIDPRKARIGIIATPGTGKSTMARALEKELGVKNLSLDSAKGGLFSGDRAKKFMDAQHGGKVPQGSILEQTYMPHTFDMDQFDAVIHLERSTDDVIDSIMKRGKGAHQADYVNYPRLKGQISESFDALQGTRVNTGGRATIKVRGRNATFNSAQGRLQRAAQLGLDQTAFSQLTQAQQIASLEAGKIVKTRGVTDTFRKGRIATDASLILGGGAVGALSYPSLTKESALTDEQRRNMYVGAGVGLGATALLTLARRPGLRAHLKAKGKSFFSSGEQKQLAKLNISGDIPKESVEHARKIIRDLRRQGYSTAKIKKMRIGVVGSSGSGKSSLARAIEQELGHTRLSLDEFVSYNPLKAGNVDVEKGLKARGGMKPGTIAEQTQLLHSGDPGHFDLLVKIERPADQIREGLLRRGHAAVTADYTDFSKAQRSVNEAFHTAGGKHRNIGGGVEIRVNPLGGKDAAQRRLARAHELGLDTQEFSRLSQRDQIQSLARGKMTRKQSFRGHISSGALGQDVGIGAALLLGGGATGALMSKQAGAFDALAHVTKGTGTGLAAAGALAGAGVGAVAGGEGNRLGGALTGAMIGAAPGMLVRAPGAKGVNALKRRNMLGSELAKHGDDVLLNVEGAVVTAGGKPLTAKRLSELQAKAAMGDETAAEAVRGFNQPGNMHTVGDRVKMYGALESAAGKGDAAFYEVLNSEVKAGRLAPAQADEMFGRAGYKFNNDRAAFAQQQPAQNAQRTSTKTNAPPAPETSVSYESTASLDDALSDPFGDTPLFSSPPATTPVPSFSPLPQPPAPRPSVPPPQSPPGNPTMFPPTQPPAPPSAAATRPMSAAPPPQSPPRNPTMSSSPQPPLSPSSSQPVTRPMNAVPPPQPQQVQTAQPRGHIPERTVKSRYPEGSNPQTPPSPSPATFPGAQEGYGQGFNPRELLKQSEARANRRARLHHAILRAHGL